MTLYLILSLVLVGALLLFNLKRVAIVVALLALVVGFCVRLLLGEELRAVAADALFVLTIVPIAWWFANRILHDFPPADQVK